MTVALTTLQLLSGREDSATMLDMLGLAPATSGRSLSDTRYLYKKLAQYFEACASGARDCELVLMSETYTPTLTITVSDASVSNGDTLTFTLNNGKTIVLTWTTGTAGTYAPKKRSNDATDAKELGDVINANPDLNKLVRATYASAVVTLTPRGPWTETRSCGVTTSDATAMVISVPNLAPRPRKATIAITHSNVGGDETIVINGVTLTAKASPSGENEWDIKTTDATDAVELAAIINAHSILKHLVTADGTTTSGSVILTSKFMGALGAGSIETSDNAFAVTQPAAQSASSTVAFATTTFGRGL